MLAEFQQRIADLKRMTERARKEGISLTTTKQGSVLNFKAKQQEQLKASILTNIKTITNAASTLGIPPTHEVMNVIKQLNGSQDVEEIDDAADNLLDLATSMQFDTPQSAFKKPKVPAEIKNDIHADLDEVQRCIDAKCYRSAVILCGRILETALHRKYYEVTKNDLLEKSPGIGLGNLIAKLAEQNVKLDPALGNQIHLINQVRVHSVHQKHDAFRPSATQAQAIVLYTIDVLEKLFA